MVGGPANAGPSGFENSRPVRYGAGRELGGRRRGSNEDSFVTLTSSEPMSVASPTVGLRVNRDLRAAPIGLDTKRVRGHTEIGVVGRRIGEGLTCRDVLSRVLTLSKLRSRQ